MARASGYLSLEPNPEFLRTLRRGERYTPELAGTVVLLEEFNSKRAHAPNGSDLTDDPGCNLGSALVTHNNFRSDGQFARGLDGGTVLVQIDGLGVDRVRPCLNILSRQSNGRGKRHPGAAALGSRVQRNVHGGDAGLRLMKAGFHSAVTVSKGSEVFNVR